ncbi:hypothetical protein RB593_005584 [Gaeumannomyces tritici]
MVVVTTFTLTPDDAKPTGAPGNVTWTAKSPETDAGEGDEGITVAAFSMPELDSSVVFTVTIPLGQSSFTELTKTLFPTPEIPDIPQPTTGDFSISIGESTFSFITETREPEWETLPTLSGTEISEFPTPPATAAPEIPSGIIITEFPIPAESDIPEVPRPTETFIPDVPFPSGSLISEIPFPPETVGTDVASKSPATFVPYGPSGSVETGAPGDLPSTPSSTPKIITTIISGEDGIPPRVSTYTTSLPAGGGTDDGQTVAPSTSSADHVVITYYSVPGGDSHDTSVVTVTATTSVPTTVEQQPITVTVTQPPSVSLMPTCPEEEISRSTSSANISTSETSSPSLSSSSSFGTPIPITGTASFVNETASASTKSSVTPSLFTTVSLDSSASLILSPSADTSVGGPSSAQTTPVASAGTGRPPWNLTTTIDLTPSQSPTSALNGTAVASLSSANATISSQTTPGIVSSESVGNITGSTSSSAFTSVPLNATSTGNTTAPPMATPSSAVSATPGPLTSIPPVSANVSFTGNSTFGPTASLNTTVANPLEATHHYSIAFPASTDYGQHVDFGQHHWAAGHRRQHTFCLDSQQLYQHIDTRPRWRWVVRNSQRHLFYRIKQHHLGHYVSNG